jgi:hypothetical protein
MRAVQPGSQCVWQIVVLAEYLVDMVSIRDVVCTVVAKGEVDNVLDRWSLSEESFNICR